MGQPTPDDIGPALPAGLVVTRYDDQGRPAAGFLPRRGDAPGRAVTIAYTEAGRPSWAFVDPPVTADPIGRVARRIHEVSRAWPVPSRPAARPVLRHDGGRHGH
ncbi:hypothetical protein ABT369_25720 [Dactylosporangium sp. NPDC000244]|uniref:hypothetical protein n=1 Tax=Dactylosporangium sp. NPDC000244 TaxID=3154365 RepID=UPI0033259632